ncbi:MAG: hypothetical protein H8E26_01715 [FCB group bacterium]|nr:hypothetical protein [FCB group bacterium]MBL7029419.1 hypothetical protein [Candidatus Neomarinimicrobiota bacterium]
MKNIIVLLIIIVGIVGCEKTEGNDGIPGWLEPRIEELASDQQYTGTIIYRYDWNSSQFYEVWIPISSCALCEVYDSDGDIFESATNEGQDFYDNRENQFVVWAWGEN